MNSDQSSQGGTQRVKQTQVEAVEKEMAVCSVCEQLFEPSEMVVVAANPRTERDSLDVSTDASVEACPTCLESVFGWEDSKTGNYRSLKHIAKDNLKVTVLATVGTTLALVVGLLIGFAGVAPIAAFIVDPMLWFEIFSRFGLLPNVLMVVALGIAVALTNRQMEVAENE